MSKTNIRYVALLIITCVVLAIWWLFSKSVVTGNLILRENVPESEFIPDKQEETVSLGATLVLERIVLDYGVLNMKLRAAYAEDAGRSAEIEIEEGSQEIPIPGARFPLNQENVYLRRWRQSWASRMVK